MKNTDFNLLAKEAYESVKKRGFHQGEHSDMHWVMLMACELAEAVEADRCGRWVKDRQEYERLKGVCDESVHAHLFEMHIKDTVEDELADVVIRALDYIGLKGMSIKDGYISEEKMREVVKSTFKHKDWEYLKTFAERVYVACMMNIHCVVYMPETLLWQVFAIAELYGIDLMWFVREKMEYNTKRVHLHGKAY